MTTDISQLICRKCGHTWVPRQIKMPKQCPRCHSPNWLTGKKLAWQDTSTKGVLKNTVVGHFAMWAVRQSPYPFPGNISKGIAEFDAVIDFGEDWYKETTCKELEQLVCDAISKSDTVVSWNSPKKGELPEFVFVDGYSEIDPDYDIIDLHALARNVAHSVWLELCYDDGFFEPD